METIQSDFNGILRVVKILILFQDKDILIVKNLNILHLSLNQIRV